MSVERTLTFVGGGSAKFWAVRQDGAELRIRYGRLGTAGQTQIKSFGSAAVATAAADKLVAEKLRKGYTEDETTSSPQVASPAAAGSVEEEDRLTLPPAWLRALHPRRGGAKVSVQRPDAGAPEKLATELDKRRKDLADTVAKCPDPELASARARDAVPVRRDLADRTRPGVRGGGRDRAGFAGLRPRRRRRLVIRQLADGEAPDRWYGWASAQQIDARVRAAAKMMTDLNGVASGNDGPAVKCRFRAG